MAGLRGDAATVRGAGDRQLRRRRQQRRRRATALAAVGIVAAVVIGVASCGSGSNSPGSGSNPSATNATSRVTSRTTTTRTTPRARHVVVTPPAVTSAQWVPVARVYGHDAAWVAQRGGLTLMRFDQNYVHMNLHAGSQDGGVAGWTYGDQISRSEIHTLIAGFNGGFKLTYSNVGFESGGHVAIPLKSGLASIVTYTDGTTNIGAWNEGVPTRRKTVFSVLQNQRLLIDRGVPAANLATCVQLCWGGTIQNLTIVARSGLGVTADGQLVWAAGQLSPPQLADGLVAAGAVRAIELDINPAWVAGYLYPHHATGPVAVPVIPNQRGIIGQLLRPDLRDFFAIVAD